MPQARRIGHATFETPDLEREIDYWVNVAGLVLAQREGKRAYLATKTGQLVVELHKGDRAHCTGLSFEVSPKTDFAQVAKDLSAEGVTSALGNDTAPGIPQALVLEDNKGTKVQLFSNWNYLGDHHQVTGVGPMKLGHVAFITPDVQGVTGFYEKVLGFRISDWIGDQFVFMRCNPDHHTVNFFRSETTRVHHMAFELKDFAHVQQGCETLSMHRIPLGWGPLRQGAGHNIAAYHRSPDDHVVEYFCELDQMKNEDLGYFEPRPWHSDRPQRPKVWTPRTWVDGWGTPPAPNFARDERALGATAKT